MNEYSLEDVADVRIEYEFNVSHVEDFLKGVGLDMGCGSCPLMLGDTYYVDISPQPLCEIQVSEGRFIQQDAVRYTHKEFVDFVFSSHMVEDLPTEDHIVECINGWAERLLKPGGYLVLLLPDMQGGRYATVEDGGNPSHRVNVGRVFIGNIMSRLPLLKLVQIDTIPHEQSCTIDVVFERLSYDL